MHYTPLHITVPSRIALYWIMNKHLYQTPPYHTLSYITVKWDIFEMSSARCMPFFLYLDVLSVDMEIEMLEMDTVCEGFCKRAISS